MSVLRLAAVVAAAGLGLSGLPALAAPSAGDPVATGVEVEPRVRQELAAQDTTTFWVYLREQADLRPAADLADRGDRGRFVYERLTATARASQADLLAMLDARRVAHEAFWIANTVRVTGDEALLERITAMPEVAQIAADRVYRLPQPEPGEEEPRVNAVEWGVDRIRAPQVWSTFGTTGGDIVVGTIDTGAQYDHPALVGAYQGNLGDGGFDHNYHWWDPSQVCGSPSLVPCDNNGHGTHVTGTVVGDDGGGNQVGVAPGATWIAAKGCESRRCSQPALLSAGQFMLAPTDLQGNNEDPERRPHIVNNSWGGEATSDPWYQATVRAWVAAGIFPQFAVGNDGPACGTAGNPGNLAESYAAGAFDINDDIYVLSSRGPSAWGEGIIKPDLAAPGVNVRSAWNNGGYRAITGTSMATPHVTGTVALLWSVAPALVRDVDATRELLDLTAIDTTDLSCGGTAEDNNVWGQGRLDAFAAVEQAPRGPSGRLTGTVTDAATAEPIAGATVTIGGEVDRVRVTGDDGAYAATLPVGLYEVTAERFGYFTKDAGVTIVGSETLVRDFELEAAPTWAVSGVVSDPDGGPVAGATVTIGDTPLEAAVTGADGSYRFEAVPEGGYQVSTEAGRCHDQETQPLAVAGATTLDVTLPWLVDDHGYQCQEEDAAGYLEGDTALGLSGLDEWVAQPLPFAFPFYGEFHDTAYVSTKGYLNFLAGNAIFSNTGLPNPARPDAAVYPFWDDLEVDGEAGMWTGLRGRAPQREYVIEWRNVTAQDAPLRMDVGVVLHENGDIRFQYRNVADGARARGGEATIGIEDPTGTVAHQYSFHEAVLPAGESSLRYRLPRHREGFAWHGDFYGPGVDSVVYSSTVWDDGDGRALYAGGAFQTVGGDIVNGIARWDGESWTPLGSGMDGIVEVLSVYGGDLIAGGSFRHAGGVEVNGVARWDGEGWHPLGAGMGGTSTPIVWALAEFDGDLVAGGNFRQADGRTANRIARWDGTGWAPLGDGMNNRVEALAVYQRELVAGGAFSQAGGTLVNGVARWDGNRWAPLSGPTDVGMNAPVFSLAVFDGALVAGGVFQRAGGVDVARVARWDGVEWSPMGSGLDSDRTTPVVRTLAVFDGELVAGGSFTATGGSPVNRIARWDGAQWSALGDGLEGTMPHIVPEPYTLSVFEGRLIAGGNFTDAGGATVNRIAAWDGAGWSGLAGASGSTGVNRFPQSLIEFGGDLIVGGDFSHAGGQAVGNLARWDGREWSAMSSGLSGPSSGIGIRDLVEYQGDLIAAGHFSHIDGIEAGHIARWDGEQWHPLAGPDGLGLGGPSGSTVEALAIFQGDLVAAGHFTSAGGVPVDHIARWDGERWHPLGGGVGHRFTAPSVSALAVHDGALYAGGGFLLAGGQDASNIARWEGEQWSPLGAGVSSRVAALTVFDGDLVAGGGFTSAGGTDAGGIARWDGEQWSPLGAGVSGGVRALTVFDGDLVAGGGFREAGGHPAGSVAAWNGVAWSALAGPHGEGTDRTVSALAALPPGTAGLDREALAVGGTFRIAGGQANWGLAFYGPVEEPQPVEIVLAADGRRERGRHVVDLTWAGATSAEVDIHRDGELVATVANDGTHTDRTGGRGSASYTYQVCEAGTAVCSPEVPVRVRGGPATAGSGAAGADGAAVTPG